MLCAEDARTDFDKIFDGMLQGSMHQMPKVAARTSTKMWPGAFGTAGRIYVMELPESSPRLSKYLITVLNALNPTSSLFETMCSLVIDYSDLLGDSFQSTGRYLALRS